MLQISHTQVDLKDIKISNKQEEKLIEKIQNLK